MCEAFRQILRNHWNLQATMGWLGALAILALCAFEIAQRTSTFGSTNGMTGDASPAWPWHLIGTIGWLVALGSLAGLYAVGVALVVRTARQRHGGSAARLALGTGALIAAMIGAAHLFAAG